MNTCRIFLVILLSATGSIAAENDSNLQRLAKDSFWEDRSINPGGYFVLSKGRAETRVIDGLRKALDSLPRNRRFDCSSSQLILDKGISEEHDQDTFFFRSDFEKKVMLSVVDLSGGASAFRLDEAFNEKVQGKRATVALVIDKDHPKNSRWAIGWDLDGGSVALYVENNGKTEISKKIVMQLAESVQCKRFVNSTK